jgi:low temperature requirement protein LtrA
MNAYGASNNNSFNSSKANITKLFLLTFLGVQAIRQLVLVNAQASGDKAIESRAGQVASWMTITMTMVAAGVLYAPKTPHRAGLVALFVAAMGSGVAMIYDYTQSKSTVEGKRTRLFFGIAHVLLALAVLVYLIMSNV